MRRNFNNMNELQRLIQKNGAVLKNDAPSPAVKPVLKPVESKPEPTAKEHTNSPQRDISLEGISLLRKQNERLSEAIKALTVRLNEQDKLIAELTKEEKTESVTESKARKFKFKITRNSDGLIDIVEVNSYSEDEPTVETVENKTLTAVKEILTKGR